ncbi:MAG: PIN domain-containing protein [Bacteroidetes bacterium]|jgi:predicted nucleic acid-binding protein|nr:PIN domain-containing protein [Bacteroidota bacterium]
MNLLDTNVLSELMRAKPDNHVAAWISSRPVSSLFISTITQAEILYGIALLHDGTRKKGLYQAAINMFNEDFHERILPFDSLAAKEYAQIASKRRNSGQPISQFDAQIAAIARSRGAGVVTRNDSDFMNCGIEVINPWIV